MAPTLEGALRLRTVDVGGTDPAKPRIGNDGIPRRASSGGIEPNRGDPATNGSEMY